MSGSFDDWRLSLGKILFSTYLQKNTPEKRQNDVYFCAKLEADRYCVLALQVEG